MYISSRFFFKSAQTFKGFNSGFSFRRAEIPTGLVSQGQVTHPAPRLAHKLGTVDFAFSRHCDYSSSALLLANACVFFYKILKASQHFYDLCIL